MHWHGALTAMMVSGAAPFALAAETLPIDGTFGNDKGCKLARSNEYSEDDSARILRTDRLQTMMTACTFVRATATAGGFEVTMTCASEGEGPDGDHLEKAKVEGDPQMGYAVAFADGTQWERLHKCK